jgi:hypothetical protein
MKRSSNNSSTRRDETLRLQETHVKQDDNRPCPRDFATRLTDIVNETARIRKAFELAASELSRIISLVVHTTFNVLGALSLLWLAYLILVKHWNPGGIGGIIVSALSIFLLLGHSIEIARRILKDSNRK